jgi:hypothetical protein
MDRHKYRKKVKSLGRRACFSLVEIALALGVVGIGMAGVMGLYSVALKASRNAVAENYMMNSAEQFLCFLEMEADTNWTTFIAGVPSVKPVPTQLTVANNWGPPGGAIGDIYTTGTTLVANEVYGVMMRSENVTDFSAHTAIWKTALESSYGADTPQFYTDTGFANSAIVNIEISWPVERPYAARTKRVYSIMLARKLP